MAITIGQLYESVRNRGEITLVAGEEGLEHVVRWVHMVEGTDIASFLEGDEVAFTTGIALRDMKELTELVQHNQKQGAAAMVINVGPYIEQIPKEVIDFGNRAKFPIFCVPWRVHMSNIMREFTTQINLDDMKKMEVEAAIKNAFFLPQNVDLYLPVLQKNGYKKDWSYCAAVFEAYDKKELRVDDKLVQKLFHYALEYFHCYQKKSVVLENNGTLVIVCYNVTEEQVKEQFIHFQENIQKYLDKNLNCYFGIGRAVGSADRIGESFAQAEQVKHLQKKRKQKNCLLTYSELGLYKLLFALENQGLLEEYYAETLGFLEKYDRLNETDFVYFLKKYFELGCSVQDVAASLHLHRNSVTYKLHKIEEILKLSVNQPYDRTRLMVALMIQEIR